jgi:Mrp family chromosome partitioning ATPase
LRTLDGVVSRYEEKLKTVPGAEFGLAQLTRETEVYSAMYSQLLKKQQETALVKASSISKNRILDAPQVPYREEPLRMWIGLASAPLGLVLGMVLVLFRSLISGRLQHGADVRRHLGPIPVLSTIPHLVHESDRLSPVGLEAFRTLRANIYNACRRDVGNVILFTSPCSGDGKSTILRHLASSLARCGRSVLLIDTGLRKQPSFDTGTGPEELGLGAILFGRRAWRDVVREVVVVEGETFDIIQGGNDESTDLLSSAAMFEFVTEVGGVYDFVLLEAPSFPATSDTLVLSAMASCVVAVIRMEYTSRHLAVDNVRQLSATTANYWLLLNDVTA